VPYRLDNSATQLRKRVTVKLCTVQETNHFLECTNIDPRSNDRRKSTAKAMMMNWQVIQKH